MYVIPNAQPFLAETLDRLTKQDFVSPCVYDIRNNSPMRDAY